MATQFSDTTVSSFTASIVHVGSGTATNFALTNAFTFQKAGQSAVLNLDQNGLTSTTSILTNITVTNANVTSLSASSVYVPTAVVEASSFLVTSVTSNFGTAQAGRVNVSNSGLADTTNFLITVSASKVSSASSVINVTFLCNHDYASSGITLKRGLTTVETGKFTYGIYVDDPLGSSFADNFSIHFSIINSTGS